MTSLAIQAVEKTQKTTTTDNNAITTTDNNAITTTSTPTSDTKRSSSSKSSSTKKKADMSRLYALYNDAKTRKEKDEKVKKNMMTKLAVRFNQHYIKVVVGLT